MSSRILAIPRVRALPVDAAFSWPVQPEFKYTDFLSIYGTQGFDGTDVIEIWPIADCVTPRRKFVTQSQYMAGVPNITDLFHPNVDSDPRIVNTTNNNLWWTEASFGAGTGIIKKEYRAFGSAEYSGGSPNSTAFKTVCYRQDSRNSEADAGWDTFTLVANTNLDFVTSFDPYGNPNLGPRQPCQGFIASLTRGTYLVKQQYLGGPGSLTDTYQIETLNDWTPEDLYWDDPSSLTQTGPTYSAVRFRIACGADTLWVELKFPAVGHPEMYVSPDEYFSGKDPVQPMKNSAKMEMLGGQSQVWTDVRFYQHGGGIFDKTPEYRLIGSKAFITFQVTLIGGFLHVEIEGEVQPLVWDMRVYHSFDNYDYSGSHVGSGGSDCSESFHKGDPIGRIEQIKVVFSEVNYAEWYVNLTRWDTVSRMLSKPINIGYVPQTPLVATIHYAHYLPAWYDVSMNFTISGTEISYLLYMQNAVGLQSISSDEYADETVAVRAVTLGFDEILRTYPGVAVELNPEAVFVNQQFDINDLNVITTASLQFNNFKELYNIYGGTAPHQFLGEWAAFNGIIALTIEVMLQEYAPESAGGGLIDQSGWVTLFTGYGNVSSVVQQQQGGKSTYTMQCQGRELPMNAAKFNIPWMDGWNEYYAAAYLANIAGVKRGTLSDTDLAFRAKVPDTPFDDSPGGGAYFLPMGNGGSPLMRFAAGTKPWQALGKIGRNSGFVRYFDAFGKFHWEKFDPSAQKPDKVLFVDFNSPEPFDSMSTVFNGQVHRDLSQVRNKVAVIGIDAAGPLWFPIVSMRTDYSSLYGHHSTIWDNLDPVANFKGFEDAFVWADSQFANPAYASRAADEAFRVMRAPNVTGSYATWLKTDVYPGKWLGVVDVRGGTYDRSHGTFLPLFCMGVSHKIVKGQVPTTNVTCRYIPN